MDAKETTAEILERMEGFAAALIKARLIKARKLGRDWYIDRASAEDRSLKALAARDRKPGRPRK